MTDNTNAQVDSGIRGEISSWGGEQAGVGLVVPDCQIKLLRFADSRAGKERKRTRERQNAKGGTDFPELRNCSGLQLEYS